MPVPAELRTARLLLRPWHPDDAPALLPILEANQAHLAPWIPRRVYLPAPLPELAERLGGFAKQFAIGREWRYGLFLADTRQVLGEVGLFPRVATGRVAYDAADCVEIGYWLRADLTGRGLATEAARAALDLARTLPRIVRAEIRCDERNTASSAIPKRLGFRLATTLVEPPAAPGEPPVRLQVWEQALAPGADGRGGSTGA